MPQCRLPCALCLALAVPNALAAKLLRPQPPDVGGRAALTPGAAAAAVPSLLQATGSAGEESAGGQSLDAAVRLGENEVQIVSSPESTDLLLLHSDRRLLLTGGADHKLLRDVRAAEANSAGGGRKKTWFLHIPKTAGMSLIFDAVPVYKSAGRTFMMREGCFDWAGGMPGVTEVMTLLRQPRTHVLSQYMHCTTLPQRSARFKSLMPPTFEAWLRNWTELRASGGDAGDFTPLLYRLTKDLVPATSTDIPFKCNSPVSPQSQRLTCQRPWKYPRTINASRAIENMNRMWMVGIVEAYQESLCLLHATVTGALPATCDCERRREEADEGLPHHHETHGVAPHSVDDHAEEVLALIDGLTAEDTLLYRAAVQRFVRDVRQVEQHHGVRILCREALERLGA
mmetsp:Transcript_31106/g.99281  ORF Transcript_31106/g.99281 Transcript_31106/m.99281 type:complete len:399 (+) Transcript_31106:102-1298(+)